MTEMSDWEIESILDLLEKIRDGEDPLILDDEIDACIDSLKAALGERE